MMKHTPTPRLRRRAFTLMETLLAVAIIGVVLSIVLSVFVPARGLMHKALTKQEADRIVSILRAEINTIRPNEQALSVETSAPGSYATAFDKGFYWIRASLKPETSIVIFSYRADTSKPRRADGTYPSIPATRSKPGADTQLTTIACPMNSSIHKDDIKNAIGNLFLVKLTQIEETNSSNFKLAKTPGTISGAESPAKYYSRDNADWAWGGAIYCRADFYLMTPNPARYKNRPWSRVGKPIFSANFSFRR